MAKKQKAKLTIKEFQTWLEGIMEFQSSDWSPNKEQWDSIYDRIMNLKQETNPTVNLSTQSMNQINESLEELKSEISSGPVGPPQNPNFNQPQYDAPQHPNPHPEPARPQGELFGGQGAEQTQNAGGPPSDPIPLVSEEEFQQLSPEEFQEKLEQAKKGLQDQVDFSGGNKQSTPHIDTSDGSYQSNFL